MLQNINYSKHLNLFSKNFFVILLLYTIEKFVLNLIFFILVF